MQVSVEATGALERRITVEVPWDIFVSKEADELKKYQQKAKIPGFRPGKAPLDMVKRSMPELRNTIIYDLMREHIWNAIDNHNKTNSNDKLTLASAPHFQLPVVEEGKPLSLSAVFEVFPTIELKGLTGVEIAKPAATVSDKDINDTIDKLRTQLREWVEVNRPAADGDRIELDFEGFVNDEPFAGNTAKQFHLELGSKRMIPGFEEAIVGIKAGEERTIDVTFPAEYHAAELAGKPAKFKIHAHKVEEPKLPEVDAKFAEMFGIEGGDLEAMRKELRQGMERELDIALSNKLKQIAFDKLLELNPIEVPKALVAEEIENMRKQAEENFRTKIDASRAHTLFLEGAKRRVMLQLLVGEIIRTHEIKPDAERVRAIIQQRAAAYEKPEELINLYYQQKHLLDEIENLSLEEQVIDKLLADAKVVDKAMTFAEIMNAGQAGQ